MAVKRLLGDGVLRCLSRSGAASPRPVLTLYDFEASPFCRRVREHLNLLDLEHHVRPCPRSSFFREGVVLEGQHVWRHDAVELVGADAPLRFPLLRDEDLGVTVQGSDAIVQHVWEHYGGTVDVSKEGFGGEDVAAWLGACGDAAAGAEQKFRSVVPDVLLPVASLVENGMRLSIDEDLRRLTMKSAMRPTRGVKVRAPFEWSSGDEERGGVGSVWNDNHEMTLGIIQDSLQFVRNTTEQGVVLYGHEDCAVTRHAREELCCKQVAYLSVPCAAGAAGAAGDGDGATQATRGWVAGSNGERLAEIYAADATAVGPAPVLEVEGAVVATGDSSGEEWQAALDGILQQKKGKGSGLHRKAWWKNRDPLPRGGDRASSTPTTSRDTHPEGGAVRQEDRQG